MFSTTKYLALGLLVGLCLSGTAVAQTDTPTDTPTSTPTDTPTDTPTSTPTVTPTFTSTPSSTATAANTSTPSYTFTPEKSLTPTYTVTVTPTPPHQTSSYAEAGCVALSLTPVAIGGSAGRKSFNFWAVGGSIICGYNSATLDGTPGPGKGAIYPANMGLGKCDCQDAELYCITADGGTVCYDECRITTQSPTATITPTATPTETPTSTPTDTP